MTDQMLIVFGILAGVIALWSWGRSRVVHVESAVYGTWRLFVWRLREDAVAFAIPHNAHHSSTGEAYL